jgi:hypothetical protein
VPRATRRPRKQHGPIEPTGYESEIDIIWLDKDYDAVPALIEVAPDGTYIVWRATASYDTPEEADRDVSRPAQRGWRDWFTRDEARYYDVPPEPPHHFVAPRGRARHVADFDTLDDLVAHAAQLGATHVSYPEPGTMQGVVLYFPLEDGQYEAASVWQKGGYWHSQGPGSREIVRYLPRGAQDITRQAGRTR